MEVNSFITLNGRKYPVTIDTYNMKWSRAFSSQLAGNIIRLNFIDRGPGVRVFDMTITIATWPIGSLPYKEGITDTWEVQLAALEASYGQVAKVLSFKDPFGRSPGPSAQYGVFFTNLNEIIPRFSVPNKPVVFCEIELTEATQVVA